MNNLQITHIGGPTMLLDFDETRILTDPTFDPAGGEYTTGPVTLRKLSPPAIELEALAPVDYVLLSHDHHYDNLDRLGRQSLASTKLVLTTSEGAERLGGRSVGLEPWETYDLKIGRRILRIVATPARHGPEGMHRGSVIGFVVFFTDAADQSIYISGDTVWYEGVAEIAKRFPAKIAILHIGAARVPEVGPFHLTMTSEEAVKAAQAFSEAIIIPTHYEGWAHFSEGQKHILQAFQKAHLQHRLLWPKLGQSLEVPLSAPIAR